VPAPDVNTNAQTMAWVMDTVSMHLRAHTPGVVTGKPLNVGGSRGRVEATGRGVMIAIEAALEKMNKSIKGMRVVVQGFGNVGSISAKLLGEAGAKIVGISDVTGGYHNPKGIDVAAALEHARKSAHRTLDGFGADRVSNAQLLELDCDILIPAALENQIRSDNAAAVRARLVCEAANGPTTPAADRLLQKRGIPVLPDILANSGGVCVSYFEWVQNNENEQWDLEEVNHKLRTKMERATDSVLEKLAQVNRAPGEHGPIDLRTAALILAVDRVAEVMLKRGIWP
jgi:glutamate dehydrogenase (NAD(P)+)